MIQSAKSRHTELISVINIANTVTHCMKQVVELIKLTETRNAWQSLAYSLLGAAVSITGK